MTQIATRLARLRTRMAETGTDLLALGPGAHMHWLAGFTPHADERPCLMLIGADNAGFLRPTLNTAGARQHSDLPFWEWSDDAGPVAALDRALRTLGYPARTAVDEAMRADFALLLLRAVPDTAQAFASETVGYLRMRKHAAEIAALHDNARIADLAQTALRAVLRPGITEAELAEVARAAFRGAGAVPEFTIVGGRWQRGLSAPPPRHHRRAAR